MNSSTFIKTTADFFEQNLRAVARQLENGTLRASGGYSFATILRIIETPDHYIAELSGSDLPARACALRLKRPSGVELFPDASTYFNGGFTLDESNGATIQIKHCDNTLSQLTISTPYDSDVFLQRFNVQIQDSILNSEASVPLLIRPAADRLLIRDLSIIRTDSARILFRSVGTAVCIRKESSSSAYEAWLKTLFAKQQANGAVLGMNLRFSARNDAFARDLLSLTSQNIEERTIDSFIATHGELFARTLGYVDVISQPSLKWIAPGPLDPQTSKPDYLLKRPDGYWDIIDLKRALLKFKIVRGLPSRPKFHHYVSDLVSQLVRYEGYFANEANARWAEQELGIRVRNPRLIGIAGSYDTVESVHVDLALRQYKNNILVVSYFDVVALSQAIATG